MSVWISTDQEIYFDSATCEGCGRPMVLSYDQIKKMQAAGKIECQRCKSGLYPEWEY